MNKTEIIEKIMNKKEFSKLPMRDVGLALKNFDNEKNSEEEKIKLTRNLLRQIFSGFSGRKLFFLKNKDAEWFLKKHLSTNERYDYYSEIYERILKNFNLKKSISVIDFGAGVNGLSCDFFKRAGFKVNYTAIEAVGQFVDLMNEFFKKGKLNKKARAYHLSLFDETEIKKIIKKTKKPRVALMLKIVDSLEKLERDYTKKFLFQISPFFERFVLSFATESWTRRKKFYVQRNWLIDFIKENWQLTDDFIFSGERYLVFEKII